MIQELNERSREVFRRLVEAYVETGQPVGSRMLARRLDSKLSPASIRNVMADLEEAGLLFAPHTSAGRLPTEAGLRIFVDGLLELGSLTADERASIEGRCQASGLSPQEVLREASGLLSGLSRCAGLVMAPKLESPLKQIEFVPLAPGRILVIIVAENGLVENRVIELAGDMSASTLAEASSYLSMRLKGRTISDARAEILAELEQNRAELDALTERVVQAGLATWAGGDGPSTLIVSGRSNLLDDVHAITDLERIRKLFDELESKEDVLKLMEMTQGAEGVRIFIGSENKLFSLSGCSLIVAPYQNNRQQIVGAIGVIGPTRLNYARIIPMVDYTAQVIGRLIG
ncbi:MAG TPA: heat-inducible transcriptional repressor HrcA [Candidatus Sulfotelmatobacter sp.]|nr:heat-inducible transcriptional repressor HrcA [Candidatus Sulfotelmatobacter sp.]